MAITTEVQFYILTSLLKLNAAPKLNKLIIATRTSLNLDTYL